MIHIRKVGINDADLVQRVLEEAPAYFLQMDGDLVKEDCAQHELNLIPSGCSPDQKHSFVVYFGSKPIGFIDLYTDFRDRGTAMMSLLILSEAYRKQGLGRLAYEKIEKWVREKGRCSKIRIGVVDTNPVHGFWKKMGFRFTGEFRSYDEEQLNTILRVMEKSFSGS